MSNEEPPREERAPEEAPRGDEGRQPSAQEGFREDRKPDEDRRRDGGRGGDDRRRDDRRRDRRSSSRDRPRSGGGGGGGSDRRQRSRSRDRGGGGGGERRHSSRERSSRHHRSSRSRSASPPSERPRKKKASNFSSEPPPGFVPPEAAAAAAALGMPAGAMAGMMGMMGAAGMPGMMNPAAAAGMPGMMNPGMAGMMAGMMNPGMAGMMGLPGMGPGGVATTGEKTNRELFVGNTPEGTGENVLLGFLNAAMHQVKLATSPGNPIIACRVSAKFAFIELRTVEETNACLNLTGIPFMGAMLKVGRPTKYTGAQVPSSTWQQLTGAQSTIPSDLDPQTKIFRELFVGNTNPEMSEVELQDFLGAAMQQVGLTLKPGNPILSTRLSGKFAFVEMRSIEETNNALNMNGIPYMGMSLRVGRPSKYTGPQVPHLDWPELLAKYMAGELKPLAAAQEPTKVIKLGNMVTPEDVGDDEEHADIVEDTKEECAKFGQVAAVVIPRPGQPGTGFVFVSFAQPQEAQAASAALAGRTFDGKRVEATYYDEALFGAGDFSA
mmetsp:Transcript_42078/g.82787  ORF Transcript_42078/g.82787 Transcript_42078/m.82787 type:complete len:551 (-) Transcript_42078:50-1702(-)